MPGLRLLLRIAPFLVGAIAAAVWLQRRAPQRAALAAPPVPAQLQPPQSERPQSERPQLERPQPEPRHEPIDIVTVVDDLLAAGR